MTNEAMKIRQMLRAARSQLKSDLSELAKEVLQHRYGASREVSQQSADVRDLDVQYLRTELALRTMASRYALLSRIDEALEPPDEVACFSPECVVAGSVASHNDVPVEHASIP